MLATVIGLLIAIGWYFIPSGQIAGGFAGVIVALSGLFYFGALTRRDGPFTKLLSLYPLLSLGCALLLASSFDSKFVIPIWIFLTGLAIDGFLFHAPHVNLDKTLLLTDPKEVKREIDTLFEPALCGLPFGEITKVNGALEKVASVNLPYTPPAFSILYIVEQLEMIFESSLKDRYSLFCNQTLSTLVKLSLRILPHSRDIAAVCLKSVERLTMKAQMEGETSIEEKSLCTLQEAAKVYIGDPVAPAQLGSYLAILIETIYAIEKNSFRLNKEQSVKQLLIPFADMKETFELEPYRSNSEIPLAKTALDRAIDAFKTLDLVLQTMPTNQDLGEPGEKGGELQMSSPLSKSGEGL